MADDSCVSLMRNIVRWLESDSGFMFVLKFVFRERAILQQYLEFFSSGSSEYRNLYEMYLQDVPSMCTYDHRVFWHNIVELFLRYHGEDGEMRSNWLHYHLASSSSTQKILGKEYAREYIAMYLAHDCAETCIQNVLRDISPEFDLSSLRNIVDNMFSHNIVEEWCVQTLVGKFVLRSFGRADLELENSVKRAIRLFHDNLFRWTI